jgi:site-specific DNA-methyltransferase (adenine-specific)
MLNDGLTRPKGKHTDSGSASGGIWSESTGKPAGRTYGDEGSYSRFFDLDRWWESRVTELPESVQATFPFMIVPKASKAEKNEGCDKFEARLPDTNDFKNLPAARSNSINTSSGKPRKVLPSKNFHPTVKPIELMSYLVTLGSRKDDLVVDPFVGSGTTCIAAKLLGRNYMGVEKDEDYAMIATERVKSHQPKENQKASEFFTL